MIFQRNSKSNFLPLLPSTFSLANSILSTHSNFDDIRRIIICDPSFLINMLIASGEIKKVFSINEIISAVGVTKIQDIVKKSTVFPFSFIQEYKNTIDVFKLSDQVKKTSIIADLIAKDFNAEIRDKAVILNGLYNWHKFYALCYNPDLAVKKDFLTAKNFYRDYLKANIKNEEVLHAFMDNKSVIRGICKISQEIYETGNPADHFFKIFPQQDKTELEAKILKVLDSENDDFLTSSEFIDYATSLEEHIEILNAKIDFAQGENRASTDANLPKQETKVLETTGNKGFADVIDRLSDMLLKENVKPDVENIAGVFNSIGINTVLIDESLPGRVVFKDVSMAEKYEITKNDNPDYIIRMLKTLKPSKRYTNKDLLFLKNINIFKKLSESEDYSFYVHSSFIFGIKLLFFKNGQISEDEYKLLDFSIKLSEIIKDFKKLIENEKSFSEVSTKIPELKAGNRFNMLKLALDDFKLNLKNYSNIDHFKFGDIYIIFDLLNKKYENVMKEFYSTVVNLNN